MSEQSTFRTRLGENALVRFWIDEITVIVLIFISTLVLILDEFPTIHNYTRGALFWIDFVCIIYFIIEVGLKIFTTNFRTFWQSRWNQIDFVIIILSLPSLMVPFFESRAFTVFLLLRLGRLVRFFRILRFIPNTEHIYAGLIRALKASIGIFVILFILILAFAAGATMLFGKAAPEYFGNPLISSYTLFKVFTLEGWFEIPDQFAERGFPSSTVVLIRLYFIAAVLIGGILGLSLANAIFVDEMTADNTYKVESMVAELNDKVTELHQTMTQEQVQAWQDIQQELKALREAVAELKQNRRDE